MTQSLPEFTVLMALWKGDEPAQVIEAISSATTGQTLPPAHLVLTVDGELPPLLADVAERAEAGEWGSATVIRSSTHEGLAAALQRGLEKCPTEIVARADADDVNYSERFATQLPAFVEEQLDLMGSAMREISSGALRERPLTHKEIRAYVRDHNPFQHPTVMFRKSVVLAAGGYRELPFMEDWYLWYRMLCSGAHTANLAQPLVDYRVNAALYARRGGLAPLRSDITLQRIMLRDHETTVLRALRNIAARLAYRIVGPRMRTLMYSAVIERRIST